MTADILASKTVLKHGFFEWILVYLFINYNTISNYIVIIYELSNFDHVLDQRLW